MYTQKKDKTLNKLHDNHDDSVHEISVVTPSSIHKLQCRPFKHTQNCIESTRESRGRSERQRPTQLEELLPYACREFTGKYNHNYIPKYICVEKYES